VANQTFLAYFYHADIVVKMVMLILLIASVISWTLIIQRVTWVRCLLSNTQKFTNKYLQSPDLSTLYRSLNQTKNIVGVESVFAAGYKEFSRSKQLGLTHQMMSESTQRAMNIAINQQIANAENNLGILATIGSTSPYIGLFGTVWGIMNAFHALGNVQQATIAMVAPGISEALIATAMGLFAAIPAVIAYNRLTNQVDKLSLQWENFQAEFCNLINRQVPVRT